jgi:hypothetical protein
MTRPPTNQDTPRAHQFRHARDPSPSSSPSDGSGQPSRAHHVKSAAPPSESTPRGPAPIGAVRLSTWPDPARVDRAHGSPGAGRLKGLPAPMRSATNSSLVWFRRVKRRCGSGRSPPRSSSSSSSRPSPVQACTRHLESSQISREFSCDFCVSSVDLGGDSSIPRFRMRH